MNIQTWHSKKNGDRRTPYVSTINILNYDTCFKSRLRPEYLKINKKLIKFIDVVFTDV